MLASVKGNWDVVKCLTRYGADIHVENNDKSDNALTMACLGNNTSPSRISTLSLILPVDLCNLPICCLMPDFFTVFFP